MKNVHLKSVISAIGLTLVAACAVSQPTGQTSSGVMDTASPTAEIDPFVVASVDLNRYVGEWFEIASIPRSFQSFCSRTKATYAIKNEDEISVVNTCKVGFAPILIEGTARVVDRQSNAILEVSLANKKADYRIIALDPDYKHALVTNKSRSSLFVLSRTSELSDTIYDSLLQRAEAAGVDVTKVKKTNQQ